MDPTSAWEPFSYLVSKVGHIYHNRIPSRRRMFSSPIQNMAWIHFWWIEKLLHDACDCKGQLKIIIHHNFLTKQTRKFSCNSLWRTLLFCYGRQPLLFFFVWCFVVKIIGLVFMNPFSTTYNTFSRFLNDDTLTPGPGPTRQQRLQTATRKQWYPPDNHHQG